MSSDPSMVGFKTTEIDGKTFFLQMLSPESFSCVVDYIRKTRKPPSSMERVLAQIKESGVELSSDERKELLKDAMRMDHEEAMRERFAMPEVPKNAFLEADVIALIFSLAATAKHPEYTFDESKKLVDRLGPTLVMTKLGDCFPSDPSKKDQASSSESANGKNIIGQASATS